MLEAARLALCELGVVDRAQPLPPLTARMSANLVVIAYPPGPRFYVVKVGVHTDLRREHEGLVTARAALGDRVPEPLALSHHRGFPTLVCEGVPFAPLGACSFAAADARLRAEIAHYFDVAAHAFVTTPPVAHSARIREAFDALQVAAASDAAGAYVDAIARDVDALPAAMQHGDFYANNLGLRADRLVVLDWEDFGAECLPGFDTTLLLLSLNDFSIDALRESIAPGGQHAWIVEAAERGTGVSAALLLRLMPAYLALLTRMKAAFGYGERFEARAVRALERSLYLADVAWPAEARP